MLGADGIVCVRWIGGTRGEPGHGGIHRDSAPRSSTRAAKCIAPARSPLTATSPVRRSGDDARPASGPWEWCGQLCLPRGASRSLQTMRKTGQKSREHVPQACMTRASSRGADAERGEAIGTGVLGIVESRCTDSHGGGSH